MRGRRQEHDTSLVGAHERHYHHGDRYTKHYGNEVRRSRKSKIKSYCIYYFLIAISYEFILHRLEKEGITPDIGLPAWIIILWPLLSIVCGYQLLQVLAGLLMGTSYLYPDVAVAMLLLLGPLLLAALLMRVWFAGWFLMIVGLIGMSVGVGLGNLLFGE